MEFISRNWPVLVPPALGFVGIYLLLPRLQGTRPMWGTLLGGLFLLSSGWLLIRNEAVLPETILFYAFSGLAILGAGLMLCQRNPVHAALAFALVVLSTCGLFLLLAAPFLMAATIIVYAGAIVVTFLFVIMLAQQAGLAGADQRAREPFLASLAGFLLMGTLFCVLEKTYDTSALDRLLERLRQVAESKSADEVNKLLGDPGKQPPGKMTLPILEDARKAFPGFDEEKLLNAENLLIQQPMELAKVTALFTEIHEFGQRARFQQGSLKPSADLKLSPFSGTPANADLALQNGKVVRPMSAQNVAGLGKALFTDYLLAVELAGTLLLVASIGAIAIAGRKTEGLR